MSDLDIRWQQRFGQFEKAFLLLSQAIAIENPTVSRASRLDPETAIIVEEKIRFKYFPLLRELHQEFCGKVSR